MRYVYLARRTPLFPSVAMLCAFLPRTASFHHSSFRTFSGCVSCQPHSLPDQQSLTTAHHAHYRSNETPPFKSIFLNQVEESVQNVFNKYNEEIHLLDLPPKERETVCVARHLRKRINALTRNHDCRQCWLQRAHCYCEQCPPIQPSRNIHQIFVLMHHKEICLAVDTARLLLSSFPDTSRLVVGGIGTEYQASMAEMETAIKNNKCLVLFPAEDAKVFGEVNQQVIKRGYDNDETDEDKWDVIVLDGTWSQAQKLYSRYIPWKMDGGPTRVQLSDEALALLSTSDSGEGNLHDKSSAPAAGHQLRRHPIQWKAISTLEAIRLLMNDMADATGKYGATSQPYPWNMLSSYQQIADDATRTQLGPHR